VPRCPSPVHLRLKAHHGTAILRQQQYQLDAIGSVVDLFEGQPQAAGAGSVRLEGMLPGLDLTGKGLANRFDITEAQLLENCRKVQAANSLVRSEALVRSVLDTGEEFGFPNFTVEMETGTGKTYVYLRTIYRLHEEYGFKKFVVVVPSIAIREGCSKTSRSPTRISRVSTITNPARSRSMTRGR